jgi:hypothetical protein
MLSQTVFIPPSTSGQAYQNYPYAVQIVFARRQAQMGDMVGFDFSGLKAPIMEAKGRGELGAVEMPALHEIQPAAPSNGFCFLGV